MTALRHHTNRVAGLVSFVLFLGACGGTDAEPDADTADAVRETAATPPDSLSGEIEATSLRGEELRRPALPVDVLATYQANLDTARLRYEAAPEDPDAIIWLGRRTAYLGRYRDAIEIFSDGIEVAPDDARMYRHRGHRFISTRRLDAAVADLSHAADLIEGTPDRVEPDGLPNARGIPTSTLHTNIYYHLGLAHYLNGEFDQALEAYRPGLAASDNPDMRVAMTYWLYLTLRRLDRDAEAAAVLEPITADLDVIENDSYHRLLLLFKGELTEEEVLPEGDDGVANATVGYGIGAWHLVEGRTEEARAVFERVLEGSSWAAFGYIASEAELARGLSDPRGTGDAR